MSQSNFEENIQYVQTEISGILEPEITENEKKIIKFIGEGNTNNQIAEKLFMSPDKIIEITDKLLDKTNTRNLAHLMMYAAINSILE